MGWCKVRLGLGRGPNSLQMIWLCWWRNPCWCGGSPIFWLEFQRSSINGFMIHPRLMWHPCKWNCFGSRHVFSTQMQCLGLGVPLGPQCVSVETMRVHPEIHIYWSSFSRLKADDDFSRFPNLFTIPQKFLTRQSLPDRVTQRISTQSPYIWRVVDGMCQHTMHVDVVFQPQLSAVYIYNYTHRFVYTSKWGYPNDDRICSICFPNI